MPGPCGWWGCGVDMDRSKGGGEMKGAGERSERERGRGGKWRERGGIERKNGREKKGKKGESVGPTCCCIAIDVYCHCSALYCPILVCHRYCGTDTLY